MRRFAEKPLIGRDIVCFSNDFNGDPLSKMHLMRLLARENRILWVDSLGNRSPGLNGSDLTRIGKKLLRAYAGVREQEPSLFVLSPLAVPLFGFKTVHALNRRLVGAQVRRAMRSLRFERPVSWAFLPSAAPVVGTLGEELIVYHCVDEFSAFGGASSRAIHDLERDLARKADLVIVSAEPLRADKAPFNPRTVLVRHGVDHQHFSKALLPATPIPFEVSQLRHPVIGFVGLVAEWVDVELLASVARAFPEASLVLVGAVATDISELSGLPNVHLLGRRPYASLPGFCRAFDVGLVPFRENRLTRSANPLKAREYLAAGLPVVSTPIPEVERLAGATVARGPEAFVKAIRAALATPPPRQQLSDSMKGESWSERLEEIRRHLGTLDGSALGARASRPQVHR